MLLNLSVREVRDLRTGLLHSLAYSPAMDEGRIIALLGKLQAELDAEPKCPYTHAHTRRWCGYDGCRES